ncbi:hypothetical protein EV368DRAFT_67133 [Lentinula lateritia]|nr:hypothetical protein EV368DRAFT_67133 [Lentinula lateritia]
MAPACSSLGSLSQLSGSSWLGSAIKMKLAAVLSDFIGSCARLTGKSRETGRFGANEREMRYSRHQSLIRSLIVTVTGYVSFPVVSFTSLPATLPVIHKPDYGTFKLTNMARTTKNLEELEALDGSSLNKGGLDKFKVYQEGQNRFHYGGSFEADQIRAREDDQAKETLTYGKQHSTVFKLLSATIIDVEPSTQSTLRCSVCPLQHPAFSCILSFALHTRDKQRKNLLDEFFTLFTGRFDPSSVFKLDSRRPCNKNKLYVASQDFSSRLTSLILHFTAMKLDYQPLVIQRKYKNNHVRGSMSADETWVLYLGQRCNLHANVTIEGTQATLIPSLDGHAQRYKAGENIVGWLGVYANFSDAKAMFDVRKEMLASHLLLSVDTNLEILNQAIKFLLAKGLLWKEDENGQREQVVDVPRWNELYAKMKPTGPAGASLAHSQSVIMYTKVGGKEAWIMLIGDHAFRAEGEQGQDTLKATEVPSPELLEGPLYPLGTSVHFKDDAVMQDAFRKICAIRPGSKLVFIKQALEVLLEEGAYLI